MSGPTPPPRARPPHRLALAVALLLITAAAACSSGAEVTCRDERCPAGEVCGASGCEAATPPDTTTTDLGRYTSTALTPDGRLVAATYDAAGGNLVVAREQADRSLALEIVDGWAVRGGHVIDNDSGLWTDLVVTDTAIHLVWFDATAGVLRYAAQPAGGAWRVETVDGGDGTIRGTHATLAVKDGVAHVAYRDDSARALRYARRELDGTWKIRFIDVCAGEPGCGDDGGEEDYGEWADIAIIGQMPRIAFYDRRRGDLKMATRRVDGVWETTTLDGRDPTTGADTGDVGRFVSLALTAGRQPGLAYFDATRGSLRYLVPGDAPIVVDAGTYTDPVTGVTKSDPVGQFVRLRYSPDDHAVMIYLDAGALALKEAVVSGANVVAVRRLDSLDPGVFVGFEVVDDRVIGAYGAWIAGAAPRTRLATFDLPLVRP